MKYRIRLMLPGVAAILALFATGCAPTPNFTADPTGGTQPVKVTFEDKSATLGWLRIDYSALAPLYGWEWDFGDGVGSTTRNPSHEYKIAGEYTVKLTVSNMFGTATVTKPNLIKVTTPASGPTARFSFTVDPENNLRLIFKDDSTPGTRPIISWLWDFGDNATSTERNPTHTYARAGIYTVSLTVQTVVGADEEEKSVAVAQTLPTAAFRSQADAANTLSIFFTDESTAGTQPITKWEWTFGDNTSSTEQNPRHTYSAPGDYQVRLKVTTAAGTDDETKTLTVVGAGAPASEGGSGESR